MRLAREAQGKAETFMVLRAIALILVALAVLQWITFTFPETNPLYTGGLFVPGIADPSLNFAVVVAVAGIGVLLWRAGDRGRRR